MSSVNIKCPKCAYVFKPDGTGYSEIIKQIEEQVVDKAVTSAKSTWEEKNKAEIQLAVTKVKSLEADKIAKLEKEKIELQHSKEIEINKAVFELAQKNSTLENELKLTEKTHKEELKKLERAKDEQIEFYKDLKAKQSTKLVGETLEKHCEIEFEKHVRPLLLDKNIIFEKDNDAKSGSKGDYIFKEFSESGAEVLSIMFEMKNEEDETATKKKNDDFLDKLHKDRENKNCEYAVLVSMLEADNDLYNGGIVNKAHKYDKMYVVRPQFFVTIITLLRDAAQNAVQYKNELMIVKNQNLDITNFETELTNFKGYLSKNYGLAKTKFDTAIKEIDKAIASLEKTKKSLLSSSDNLRLSSEKADDLTIKKLTRNNPTMQQKFNEIKKAEVN